MNKPISVSVKETRKKICDVINESGLPISVIELILSDVYGEVQVVSRQQYEADLKAMQEES